MLSASAAPASAVAAAAAVRLLLLLLRLLLLLLLLASAAAASAVAAATAAAGAAAAATTALLLVLLGISFSPSNSFVKMLYRTHLWVRMLTIGERNVRGDSEMYVCAAAVAPAVLLRRKNIHVPVLNDAS